MQPDNGFELVVHVVGNRLSDLRFRLFAVVERCGACATDRHLPVVPTSPASRGLSAAWTQVRALSACRYPRTLCGKPAVLHRQSPQETTPGHRREQGLVDRLSACTSLRRLRNERHPGARVRPPGPVSESCRDIGLGKKRLQPRPGQGRGRSMRCSLRQLPPDPSPSAARLVGQQPGRGALHRVGCARRDLNPQPPDP